MLNKYCYRYTNHILKHGLCIHNNNTMIKLPIYNKVVCQFIFIRICKRDFFL